MRCIAAMSPGGTAQGYGLAVTGPFDPTMQPGHFEIQVRVEREARGRGLGSAIYRDLEGFALAYDALALETCVGDGNADGLAWATRRAFTPNQHVFSSRLDLNGVDLRSLALREGGLPAGVTIRSLAAFPETEEHFAQFVDLWRHIMDDVPGSQPEGANRPVPRELLEIFSGQKSWERAATFVADDGERWIALSILARRPDGYYNWLTGVRAAHRGKGLGFMVKSRAIQYAVRQEAHYVFTHNDSRNRPMLAINRKLGFEPTGGMFWLIKRLT